MERVFLRFYMRGIVSYRVRFQKYNNAKNLRSKFISRLIPMQFHMNTPMMIEETYGAETRN